MADWSLSTPSTTLPSLIFPPPPPGPPAQAASSAPVTASTAVRPKAFMVFSLDSEVVEEFVFAGLHLVVVQGLDDPALGEEVVPVGHGRGEVHVLLDEQHRHALPFDLAEDGADLLDDQRG